jgi:hypothetical protein
MQDPSGGTKIVYLLGGRAAPAWGCQSGGGDDDDNDDGRRRAINRQIDLFTRRCPAAREGASGRRSGSAGPRHDGDVFLSLRFGPARRARQQQQQQQQQQPADPDTTAGAERRSLLTLVTGLPAGRPTPDAPRKGSRLGPALPASQLGGAHDSHCLRRWAVAGSAPPWPSANFIISSAADCWRTCRLFAHFLGRTTPSVIDILLDANTRRALVFCARRVDWPARQDETSKLFKPPACRRKRMLLNLDSSWLASGDDEFSSVAASVARRHRSRWLVGRLRSAS